MILIIHKHIFCFMSEEIIDFIRCGTEEKFWGSAGAKG
jgi:hypothetical protein